MNSSYRQSGFSFSFGSPMTPMVKRLIWINVGIGLPMLIAALILGEKPVHTFTAWLKLRPEQTLLGGQIWQLLTYSFLHSTSNPFHLIMNMLYLWMFGRELEAFMGSRRFLWVYLGCAVAGGIAFSIFELALGWNNFCVGASASVIGLVALYALYYPNRQVIVFIFPMKMKVLAMMLIGMDLWSACVSASGRNEPNVANVAHLGGAAFAFLFVRFAPALQSYLGAIDRQRERHRQESETEIRVRVDELLEKISQQGISTLTRKERSFLQNASKRFKPPREKTHSK